MKKLLVLALLTLAPIFCHAQHSATLSCTDATGGQGYNFYRSQISGGPYVKVNTAYVAVTCSFVDTSVTAGQTYYYVVTAINTAGQESGYSNQVVAVIPNTATPPASAYTLSTTVFSFGDVNVGSHSAAMYVTIKNTSATALPLVYVDMTGIPSTDASFTYAGNVGLVGGTCGASLAAGASCTYSAACQITSAGVHNGSFTFTVGGISNTVTMTCTGIAVSAAPAIPAGLTVTVARASNPAFPVSQ